MEKYVKALDMVRAIWETIKADPECERNLCWHRSFAEKKLEGIQLVAAADGNLSLEDFRAIMDWKLEEEEDA